MELIAWLALLYLWQCTLRVPDGASLFLKPLRRWAEFRGGGRRLLHCWPSKTVIVSVPFRAEGPQSESSRRLRDSIEKATRSTRLLGWCCDFYALLLFAWVPLQIMLLTEELALLCSLPLVGIAHGLALFALHRSHRRLFPGASSERWETLFVAGLYPPILIRSRQDLLRTHLAGAHPMVVRAALLQRDELIERIGQARAALKKDEIGGRFDAAVVRREREVLDSLAHECGLSEQELSASRAHSDPTSASYCPICLSDYRPGFESCEDCGIPTRPYPELAIAGELAGGSWRSEGSPAVAPAPPALDEAQGA